MKSSTSATTLVSAVIVFLLLIPLLTLIPTFLWYCFDDALALLAGIPALGTIAWYHMWAFTMFISMLFNRNCSSSSNNNS